MDEIVQREEQEAIDEAEQADGKDRRAEELEKKSLDVSGERGDELEEILLRYLAVIDPPGIHGKDSLVARLGFEVKSDKQEENRQRYYQKKADPARNPHLSMLSP